MSVTRLGTPRLDNTASQVAFDALMRSLSEPGTVHRLPTDQLDPSVPSIAWLALTLADVGIAVAANPAAQRTPIEGLVADATGATVTDLPHAWIAMLDQPTPSEFASLARGSAVEPELGARAAIAVDTLSLLPAQGLTGLELSGPGIPGTRSLFVEGVNPAVLAALGRHEFPSGVDTWLFTPDGTVAAIPRSTHVTTTFVSTEQETN
jgi:alpha-D-ribose 1-methylphosphonate 5-triphosphate synthase subunit PhnH